MYSNDDEQRQHFYAYNELNPTEISIIKKYHIKHLYSDVKIYTHKNSDTKDFKELIECDLEFLPEGITRINFLSAILEEDIRKLRNLPKTVKYIYIDSLNGKIFEDTFPKSVEHIDINYLGGDIFGVNRNLKSLKIKAIQHKNIHVDICTNVSIFNVKNWGDHTTEIIKRDYKNLYLHIYYPPIRYGEYNPKYKFKHMMVHRLFEEF
jgi:hypothetical protein